MLQQNIALLMEITNESVERNKPQTPQNLYIIGEVQMFTFGQVNIMETDHPKSLINE